MIIRPETAEDHRAIYDLTKAAFEPMGFSDGTEADVLDQLRQDGDLLLSLVAIEDDELIGQASFSLATLDCPGRWIGLGPISVTVARQKEEIGSNLVKTGLSQLKEQDFDGCVLIGNPKVYGPMGFQSGGITYRDCGESIVQWATLSGIKPSGEISFAPALEA